MRAGLLAGSILTCAAGATGCGVDNQVAATAAAPRPPSQCDVRIDFGSFATGPDRAAIAAVHRTLESDPAVLRVTRSRFGPEGEHSLCVGTVGKDEATRVADWLILAVPAPTSAPVTIVGPAGRRRFPTR